MQAVAFIDGMTGNAESESRRAQLPQLPTGPSFRDLLSQVERAPFNNPTQSQPISYSPKSLAESDLPEEPSRQRAFARESSSYDTPESPGSAEERSSVATEERSASERIARERQEANLRKAEEAEQEVAAQVTAEGSRRRAQESAEKSATRESSEKGTPEEELEVEKKGKLAAKLPEKEAVEGEKDAAVEVAQGGPEGKEGRLWDAAAAARERAKAESRVAEEASRARGAHSEAITASKGGKSDGGQAQQGATELTPGRESVPDGENGAEKLALRRRNPVAPGQEKLVAAETGGHPERIAGNAAREAATMVATQEKRNSDSELRSQRHSQEGEGREQRETADRKLKIVDLRAPREGRESRNRGGEHRSQTGLKENAETRQLEGSQQNTVRFEHGDSAFARQFGSGPMSRGEGVAERLAQQQQQLHRFLRESGYGEIVRNARVMLREGGNGELRLNLSPKELGSVRVQLQLQDSHIAGRIIVENSTVREVFEQNLDQLQRAFQSQGLETGKLEVTVEQRGDGQQRRGRGQPGRGDGARVFEEHTARLPDSFYEDAQVNLMA